MSEEPYDESTAVIIPSYGHTYLTYAVLNDLRRDRAAVTLYVVDNGGDFTSSPGVCIIRPSRNLGWAGGCNLGLITAMNRHHTAYMILNNDTRLSNDFVYGMRLALSDTGAGLIGPRYDEGWWPQYAKFNEDAKLWRPERSVMDVPFLDGTCLLIPHETLIRVGLLDEVTFGITGWGADFDYCLRVRQAHLPLVTTDMSFLNHFSGSTARGLYGDYAAYRHVGIQDMEQGLVMKWGHGWRLTLGISQESTGEQRIRQRLSEFSARASLGFLQGRRTTRDTWSRSRE